MAATSKSTTSDVWKYFSVNEDKTKTKCNLCAVSLSFKGSSTSAMRNHLKLIHKSLGAGASTNQVVRQSSIKEFTGTAKSCLTKGRQEELTRGIAWMCALDMRPMNIVTGRGFRRFCHLMNPSFKVPCRATVTKHVDLLYQELKKEVIEETQGTCMSLTTDMWTSVAQRGFITVTGHYITKDWALKCKVLATRPIDDKHTGKNIAQALLSIKEEFHIKELVALTTDNAANMVVAGREAEVTRVPCFSHTLQLVVNEILKVPEVSGPLTESRKLVSYLLQ